MNEQQYIQMLKDIAKEVEENTLPQLGLSKHLDDEQMKVVSRRLLDTAIRGYQAGYKRGLTESEK
jgi:hypothetical protein